MDGSNKQQLFGIRELYSPGPDADIEYVPYFSSSFPEEPTTDTSHCAASWLSMA